MEMYEKNKKIQEQDKKLIEEHERKLLRKQAQSFKSKFSETSRKVSY